MAQEVCILRCAPASTMPLVKSLTRAGIEVWTPVEQIVRRVPRANIKRTIDTAMLPSYLFVQAIHIPHLIELMESPRKDHREFHLFRHMGKIALIADDTLAPLRLLERKSRATVKADSPIKAGAIVRLEDGGFAGLSGVIEKPGTNFSSVRIEGFGSALKIANYYLLPNTEESDKRVAA